MLGEVALYSFIVLLLSGIYLGLFFDPSMAEVVYDGPFDNLRGVQMIPAYASALDISFEVRGGLFVRQVHHWAALLFIAAMFAHMFRMFFTGAFRKPREANWVIGVLLIFVGTFEGFTGYSLPDDLLSGTGLRIASGITLSVPVIGTWTHWALFGGEFPGTEIIPRLYIVHVLLLPGILLALIGGARRAGLVPEAHPVPRPRPHRGATSSACGSCRSSRPRAARSSPSPSASWACMGGLFQINPIWNFGPYNPAQVSAGSQPDFYMGWFSDGMARHLPGLGDRARATTGSRRCSGRPRCSCRCSSSSPAIYPAIERKLTKDNALHNLLQRPRDVPVRTALGVMAIAFYACAGAQRDQRLDRVLLRHLAERDHLGGPDRAADRAADRLLGDLPDLPRACSGPTGRCSSTASRPASSGGCRTASSSRCTSRWPAWTHHGHPIPLEYQGAPVPKRMNQLGSAGAPVAGSLLTPDPARRDRGAGAGPPRAGGGRGGARRRDREAEERERGALAGRPSDLED